MKHQPVKLPGRKSGWACKIIIGGTHIATTSSPEGCSSREAAIAAGYAWEREWKDTIYNKRSY